jgi:hypothetical protein
VRETLPEGEVGRRSCQVFAGSVGGAHDGSKKRSVRVTRTREAYA